MFPEKSFLLLKVIHKSGVDGGVVTGFEKEPGIVLTI